MGYSFSGHSCVSWFAFRLCRRSQVGHDRFWRRTEEAPGDAHAADLGLPIRRAEGYRRDMDLERVEIPSQIAAVAALARETWTQHYVPLIGAAQVEYMLAKFQSAEAIARQITTEGYEYYWAPGAGYLALVPDPVRKSVMLSKIYVLADRRGTGEGRAMVEFAEKRAAELGGAELWLTVNKHNAGSIAFYERMGFRKTEAVVTDIGGGFVMDDWRMAKTV